MSHVVNVVVVGDAESGKTSLLTWFFKNNVNDEDDLPTFDDYVTLGMDIDGDRVAVELRDTVSSEACRRFRLFWYMGSHVILLCFPLDRRESLVNVPIDWMPELRRICPDVPVILVGNKMDLRAKSSSSVQPEEGKSISESIRAIAYVECSALEGEGVQQLFEIAVRAGLEKVKSTNRKRCTLL